MNEVSATRNFHLRYGGRVSSNQRLKRCSNRKAIEMRIDQIPQRHLMMIAATTDFEPDVSQARCDNVDCQVPLELPIRAVAALAIVPDGDAMGTIRPIVVYHGPHRNFEIHCLLCEACLERLYAGEVVLYGSDVLTVTTSISSK